jgi:hypothetical protein
MKLNFYYIVVKNFRNKDKYFFNLEPIIGRRNAKKELARTKKLFDPAENSCYIVEPVYIPKTNPSFYWQELGEYPKFFTNLCRGPHTKKDWEKFKKNNDKWARQYFALYLAKAYFQW